MADLLSTIGTGIRQFAAWLGTDADTFLILLATALVTLFLIMFLAMMDAMRKKAPSEAAPQLAMGGKPTTIGEIEKTLLQFPAGKVHIEANVDKLVFKLVETEPKVVEKIVEVPAKEKPLALEQVNIEGAADLNAAVGLICKKYGMESLTISDDKANAVSSNSKDPKADADLAGALAPQAGWDVKRTEVRGRPSVYLYPFSKGDRKLLMLFKGDEKEQRMLDALAKDLGSLSKFL